MKKVAIIGAGAAGCFLAQRLKELRPEVCVELYEAHSKPLMKVAVTGGGRCNLTNSFEEVSDLKQVYPRGHKLLKRLMYGWSQYDTMAWFEEHGVPLVVQDDQCVFPQSQDAMQIVRTLRRGLDIHLGCKVEGVDELSADYIVVTTGGAKNFEWLERVGVEIEKPVPSLFPFKLQSTGLERLMGIVVEDVTMAIAGTKLRSYGTVLLTHFGVSGPATLRLSSYAARYLAEKEYRAPLVVNWLGDYSQTDAVELLDDCITSNPDRIVAGASPVGALTARHWRFIVSRAGIASDARWKGLNAKQENRLANALTADAYDIVGRTPHKEEFVTCGGVSLQSVNSSTLEARCRPGLFFAGEVLDIDGVTGGFNLQAAFTTANAVAEEISNRG